jgi:hypothetical protein
MNLVDEPCVVGATIPEFPTFGPRNDKLEYFTDISDLSDDHEVTSFKKKFSSFKEACEFSTKFPKYVGVTPHQFSFIDVDGTDKTEYIACVGFDLYCIGNWGGNGKKGKSERALKRSKKFKEILKTL